MAAFYYIDESRKLVMSTGYGVLTARDISVHMETLHKDPNFDPHFSQLADFTHIKHLEVTEADIHMFAQRRIFDSHARRAFIVTDEVPTCLLKKFASLREEAGEHGLRIFATLEEGVDYVLPRIPVH
jgi:hypothetical protein